jgi:hypothetical protein
MATGASAGGAQAAQRGEAALAARSEGRAKLGEPSEESQ